MRTKNIFITIFTLFLHTTLIAQQELNYNYDMLNYDANYNPISYKPKTNVKQIKYTKTDRRCNTKTYVKKFDEKGNLLEYLMSNKENILISIITCEYDKSYEKITKMVSNKTNGKLKSTTNNEYNDNGILIKREKYNSKGIMTSKNIWIFNDNQKIIESKKYKKNSVEPKKVWKYKYNENGEKIKTTLYKKNGKIQHEWSFECNDKGVKLEKQNDLTQVCKWSETSDGYIIKVYQTFDEKGKIRKYISKYTMSDTLIVEKSTYNSKDELLNKSTYDKSYDKMLSYEFYNKKNEPIYREIYIYSNDLLIKNENHNKNRIYSYCEYFYNSNNLLVELKTYKKHCKLIDTYKMEYIL